MTLTPTSSPTLVSRVTSRAGRWALSLVTLSLAASSVVACVEEGESSEEDQLINKEKKGGASQKWIYTGMLTKLDKPTLTVSLKAHTLRVTGLLPTNFSGDLPFYAEPRELANGRVELTVVYPVATGAVDPSTGKAPAGPGTYPRLLGVPYTPTNDKAAWGGFPFIKYHQSRGLAFHGPITSTFNAEMGEYEWQLKRGPVSHGCQRMQGEHVVELGHLLGMDMSKPHSSGEVKTLETPTTILSDYDVVDGKSVDVDFPVLAGVKRPTTNVRMFHTWDSRDFPRWVCAYDKNRAVGPDHCANLGEPRRDAITGEAFEVPEVPFIGTACDADADCNFKAAGKQATCLKPSSNEAGFCSIDCQGTCPDKEGASRTFCAEHAGKGQCMAKAGPENAICEEIPGTDVTLKKRYIGTSNAAAAQASVCSF